MFIAKMHTRYPEFHESGYYNFVFGYSEAELNAKVEDMSHDFELQGVVKTRHASIENVIKQYPTKQQLNKRYFEVTV